MVKPEQLVQKYRDVLSENDLETKIDELLLSKSDGTPYVTITQEDLGDVSSDEIFAIIALYEAHGWIVYFRKNYTIKNRQYSFHFSPAVNKLNEVEDIARSSCRCGSNYD